MLSIDILIFLASEVMKICICGGGSLGHVCAGVFAQIPDIELYLFTRHPDKWNEKLEIIDVKDRKFEASFSSVSSDPKLVIPDCDLVLLCLPGFLIKDTLLAIKPYLSLNTVVGSIVSNTGFFIQAHSVLSSTCKLFGFQRTPFIARVGQYGKSASLLGYKKEVSVVLENISDKLSFCRLLEKLFVTPVVLLDNYYEVTLSNSNPILHTGRLYSMWHAWDGKPFDKPSLFYKEWTIDAAQVIIDMDYEFMSLLDLLPVKKESIPSLLDYYESKDATSLCKKLRSIQAFQTIQSPMRQIEGGWVPDFNSRYFTEDFPYGLRFIRDLMIEKKINAPIIEQVYNWGISKIDIK